MKKQKPELYCDENGNPKGYRVGISNGVYGTCPFCGKSYTEEDVTNGDVNFEHIFSRFAVKKATDEKKVFSRIESEFMVAVHKDCNDKGSKELEKQISRIIDNFGKPHVHLMRDDVISLLNYCIKISIFLRYLFLWEDNTEPFCYDNEKLSATGASDILPGLNFYKNFDLRLRNVDASAGLYWGLNEPQEMAKYCFTVVLNNIEISFFPMDFEYKYAYGNNALLITTLGNRLGWFRGDAWEVPDYASLIDKRGIPWTLEKSYPLGRMYNNHIEALSDLDDDMYGLSQNYFIRQRKLSRMSQKRFEESKILDPMDKGIVFCRNDQIYFVNDDGLIQNITDLPDNTEIPAVCFRKHNISHLPDMSKLRITGNFVISESNMGSLKGIPKFIQGHVLVRNNKLTSLQDGPTYVGKSFYCDFNELTSLKGAPNKINGTFSCEHNRLSTLIGGPEEVSENFICDHNQLTSLEGAPQKISGFFMCSGNKLKTLNGAPKTVGSFFSFDAADLESLEELPKAPTYIVADSYKSFHTAEELQTWFREYKKEQKVKKMQQGVKNVNALGAVAKQSKGITIPDDQYEI